MKHIPARAAGVLATTTPVPTAQHGALAVRQQSTTSASTSTLQDLPLTTVFPVPSDCFDLGFGVMLEGTVSGEPSAFRDYSAAVESCYPPSYSLLELNTALWYSPGVCPSGYARASQQTDAADNQPDLTLAWCCPSSMAFSYDGTYEYCSSYVATSTVAGSGTYTTPVPFSEFVALQWPISVMWRSADLDSFTPASAPLSAGTQSASSGSATTTKSGTAGGNTVTVTQGTPNSTATATSSGSSTATTSASSSGGLSTGAQAGIGVGVAVPCVALLGLGAWFILYRRRNKKSSGPSDDEPKGQPYVGTKAELPGEEAQSPSGFPADKKRSQPAVELEPQRDGLNELEEQNKPLEPVELPGNAIGVNAAAEAPTSPLQRHDGYTEGQTAARKSSRDPLVEDR